jgi:hypothetical protein
MSPVPDHEADRRHLHAMVLERLHGLAVEALGTAVHAQHHRLRGAVDVGIQNADAGAFRGQGQRQVDRRGRLADPALAGGDRDDVLHIRHELEAALHRVRQDLGGHVDADVADAGNLAQRIHDRGADAGHLAPGRIAEFDVERGAVAVDLDVLDRLGADEVLAGVRVSDRRQGCLDVFCSDAHWVLRM